MTTYVKALAKKLGLKTVDARRNLRIEVSAQDIAGARVLALFGDSVTTDFRRACRRRLFPSTAAARRCPASIS